MQHEEVDLLLITRTQDVQYLTGYQAQKKYLPTACIVSANDIPRLLISEMQSELLGQNSVMSEIRPFTNNDTDTWYPQHSTAFWDHVVSEIAATGMQSGMIGLQLEWLSVREFERLKAALPEAGFKDFSSSLWKLRQIKDPSEIDMISNAVRIAEIGIMTALEIVSPEKSEIDVSIEVESAMRNAGGHLRGIRAAILSGKSARFPIATPGPQRLSDDELVVIDITVSHRGYFAEVARTIHLGKPSKMQNEMFQTNLRVFEAIQQHLAPGVLVDELAQNAVSVAEGVCSHRNILQPLGSSIGLDLREPPHILLGGQTTLRPGMVFSIHPSCYDPSLGGSKIADVVFITEDGYESSNTLARDIV